MPRCHPPSRTTARTAVTAPAASPKRPWISSPTVRSNPASGGEVAHTSRRMSRSTGTLSVSVREWRWSIVSTNTKRPSHELPPHFPAGSPASLSRPSTAETRGERGGGIPVSPRRSASPRAIRRKCHFMSSKCRPGSPRRDGRRRGEETDAPPLCANPPAPASPYGQQWCILPEEAENTPVHERTQCPLARFRDAGRECSHSAARFSYSH